MEPHILTDAAGRAWSVIDSKLIPSPKGERGKKKRLPLGDWKAEGQLMTESWAWPTNSDGRMLAILGFEC
jgi:hypothetical protein